ncbi:DUF2804 domain-containing protein [Candidatus Sumerlaeota bacterium]|nr:DUF2804 domain-containing protein [Candidatus Sumerlaeota bacterium]
MIVITPRSAATLLTVFYALLALARVGVGAGITEPAIIRPKTEQVEYTKPVSLLDSNGCLQSAGWARHAVMTYNREAIPPERRGRIKEWEHYTIMSPQFTIGLTMGQLGAINFGSFEVIEYPGGIKPGGLFVQTGTKDASIFPSNPYGKTVLGDGKNSMEFEFTGTERILSFSFAPTERTPAIRGKIALSDSQNNESVAIARPFAEEGHFFYENKIFGMPAKGSAEAGESVHQLPEGNSWAIYDWGRGIWPRECGWFWGQAAGLAGGKRVAFNLGHGYGDDSKGTCNAILFEGKLHKLDTVILNYDPQDQMQAWRLGSNDGRLTLDFHPIYHQQGKQNIVIAATELHKVHGTFSGELILDDGTKIEVKDLLGFMEHAQHQW